MNWKNFAIFILIIILILYVVFYPLRFEYYEDVKAKKISDVVTISCFGILIIYDLYWNIKKGEKNWKKYITDFFKGTTLFSVFYFLILRRFFSYLIIFTNSIFGEVETVNINGIIVGKIDRKGGGKNIGERKITIKQKETDLIFDTRIDIIENHYEGQYVQIQMKKGILNIIYK